MWFAENVSDEAVKAALGAVYGAYSDILLADDECKKYEDEGKEKSDPNVGHHAIVTGADVASQKSILSHLVSDFLHEDVRFITEESKVVEGVLRKRILTPLTYLDIFDRPLVFGVDPICGSSSRGHGLSQWSISVGVMRRGEHVGGAIFAPKENGGMLAVGERESGTFLLQGFLEKGEPSHQRRKVTERPLKGCIVYIGPDIFFLREYSEFTLRFSKEIRTTGCSGSCPLGLMFVAAGMIDGFVQPVQCPWDWFAGYPMVEAAGGKVIFYQYRGDKPERLEKPDVESYNPEYRNTAFIAGTPECAEWLFELLQKHWVSS